MFLFLKRLNGYDLRTYTKKLRLAGFKQDQLRPEIRRRMYPLRDETIQAANDKLLSFAFVRDPFDRLVSCYYNKMVMKNWSEKKQDLKWMRDEILRQ